MRSWSVAIASLSMLLFASIAGAAGMPNGVAGTGNSVAPESAAAMHEAAGAGGDLDAMMTSMHDPRMAAHLAYSPLWPKNKTDQQRAAHLVEVLKTALAKYKDYRVAEADGYKPFHPELGQPVVHFTRRWYAVKAAFTFNPAEPTSLLYARTPGGGYKLVGAMYTDSKRATLAQLDERVPLSVARWHRHINLCLPRRGTDLHAVDWTKFGPRGSITTESACEAAGGVFHPQLFGWMVHVHPWAKNPSQIWAH